MAGKVFVVNDDVRRQKGIVDIPGVDLLTLVDADGKNCTPHQSLLDPYIANVVTKDSQGSKVAHSVCL